jgi:hypothetical protein
MGQAYQFWWRICWEKFSQVRISHVLRFTSICDLFTDSSSYFLQINIIDTYFFGECCHIKVIYAALQFHILVMLWRALKSMKLRWPPTA